MSVAYINRDTWVHRPVDSRRHYRFKATGWERCYSLVARVHSMRLDVRLTLPSSCWRLTQDDTIDAMPVA